VAQGDSFSETHARLEQLMNAPGSVLEWAESHNCSFGLEKFQLADYTRKQIQHPIKSKKTTPWRGGNILVGGKVIKRKEGIKLVGGWIGDGQIAKHSWTLIGIFGKGLVESAGLAQFKRLSRVTAGAASMFAREWYIAMLRSRMLYATNVFLTPQRHLERTKGQARLTREGGRNIIRKLTSIQRQVALMVTGALPSTPTNLLDIHADLLPMPLAIDMVRQRVAVRIAALRTTHPLTRHAQDASNRKFIKSHFSLLHNLMNTFALNPKKMEKRQAVRKHAGWESEVIIRSWEGREDALKQIEEDEGEYQLFTDGLGIKGMVGSSAVLYKEGERVLLLRMQIGKETEHEVFEGESVGPTLGLELL
ncbi:hypothetical protein BT96DRAFT_764282, partial [Gymnopus androsaceus JB14]